MTYLLKSTNLAQAQAIGSFHLPNESTSASRESNIHSLAALWARKYYISVTSCDNEQLEEADDVGEVNSKEGRVRTADKLIQNLNLASAQAWAMTEALLSEEIRRHGINLDIINPLQIAADTRLLFEKALKAYTEEATPSHLSVILGRDIGQVRKKYTSIDRRAIGFVSMQFHYTGQKLLGWLSHIEKNLFSPYLKVMDDHMYMPLRDAYEAAAEHNLNSKALLAVQHLLPISTKIAQAVCARTCREHPGYKSYSGKLSESIVRVSSIRDVEMFQVYLCLCALEKNIRSVQRELFPLCVMLYPRLQVRWTLVQEMLTLMSWQIHEHLDIEDIAVFLPYIRTLSEMFSCEVFGNP